MRYRADTLTWLLVGPLVVFGGCGTHDKPALPTTYPVTGKVVYTAGEPLKGGSIQFRPEAEPGVTTTGKGFDSPAVMPTVSPPYIVEPRENEFPFQIPR